VSPLFFDSTNTSLYALSNRGRDKLVLVRLNPATGQELEVVYQNPNFDLDGAVYSRANRQLAAIEWEGDRPDMLCLLPTWKKAYLKVNDQARAEGMDLVAVEYVNADTLERTSLWVAHSDRVAARYYLYNAQTQEVKFLAAVYQWLKPSQLAQMQPVTFPAADGLKLHAYLTLPVNVPKRNLPLVLLVHGGPWARDGWGFQPEVQFLANRGYAVLQVNFRGSTGYGRQYWEKSFGQWGLKMQDDLRDAVRWAVRTGLADSTRVAIYGGSYGGYATLAGLCFQPELYRCGIDYVGVSNLFTFLNTIPPYWKPYLEMLHEMVGHPQRDSLRLRQTSPVFHVQNIRAPLLIAQGARDPRVNQAESDQMVAALRARNIPVQYMLKENEGHGFSNEENTLEFYQAMETFLQQHLGAR
jgi:dipeptidyl aminopeptidase/acylaminoacyl peptidase